MIQKEFVSYEHALALKELGFDEPCITSYNESGKLFKVWEDEQVIGITKCLAPLYQQAFKWLHQQLGFKKSVMYLDIDDREVLLNNNIKSLKEKHGNTSN